MKKKLKISKRAVSLFFLFLIILRPSSVRNLDYGVTDYILNLTYLLLAIYLPTQLLRRKFKISGPPSLVILYFVVLMICTHVNRSLTFDYFAILFKLLLAVLTVYYFWQLDTKSCMEGLEAALVFYVVTNGISVITHPNGLYVYHYVQEGLSYFSSAQFDAQWIFGQKNSFTPYIILLLLVSSLRCSIIKNKLTDMNFWTYFAISLLSVVVVKSDTSIFALGVYIFFVVCFPFFRKHPSINIRMMTIVVIIINVILIGGNTHLFGNLIYNLTGKSSNLSNRVTIWSRTLLLFSNKPIFGYGYMDSGVQHSLLGNAYFNSTHNMALQVLFYGGIVLMAVFVVMIVFINYNVIKLKNYNISFMLTAALASIFVEGLAESLIVGIPVFLCFLVMLLTSTGIVNIKNQNSMILTNA